MISKEDKIHYSRNMKLGVILSLTLSIISFLFFPKIETSRSEIPAYTEPIIKLVDIPSTQLTKGPPSIPPKPEIIIPTNIVEIEIPDSFISTEVNQILLANKEENEGQFSKKGVYEFSSLPFIPRQIIEVVPKEIDGAKGLITVSLKIDYNGYVKEHKIIKDISNKKECLENVVQAVYKSRWQPIVIDGDEIEYWIEKSYEFN